LSGPGVSKISIKGVSRSFGSVQAVRDITLEIEDGEFFTLLGPSGCGKTTLLRMIAGFTDLDAGEIRIGAKRVDTLPPHRRSIGMVFQNYAIFPNLTVEGNVAYGLKARKVAKAEIAERVADALALVRLQGYGERWPHQLSGGQLQRVAIARALVVRPEVLLLDEPLSNLDARLRIDMRGEIRELQQRLNITTVYVTHDQEEALAMSRRIAVMQAGLIEQLDCPEAIYRRPTSLFVARFMGTTNALTGIVGPRASGPARVRVGPVEVEIGDPDVCEGERVSVCIRPEALQIVGDGRPAPAGTAQLQATLVNVEFIGALSRLDVELPGGTRLKVAVLDEATSLAGPGSTIALAYDPARVSVFRQNPP
jgi:ABC-type Fe3+/spermidine/putrescine transport system ATPase subunit